MEQETGKRNMNMDTNRQTKLLRFLKEEVLEKTVEVDGLYSVSCGCIVWVDDGYADLYAFTSFEGVKCSAEVHAVVAEYEYLHRRLKRGAEDMLQALEVWSDDWPDEDRKAVLSAFKRAIFSANEEGN